MTISKRKILFILAACIIICSSIIMLVPAQETAFAANLDNAQDIRFIPDEEFQNLYYIPNSDYFIANPRHHSNYGGESANGVCTTVALQLLLGYHNYYSDRRLIPEESPSGLQFLSDDYGKLDKTPQFILEEGYIPYLGRTEIGTNDAVFDEIRRLTPFESIGLDQLLNNATTGTNNFINHYSQTDSKPYMSFGLYSQQTVKNQLSAGNPVVLGMVGQTKEGKLDFHVVVIYGFADYNGEFGYIGHWGWGDTNVKMWAPESWFEFQVTMNVVHQHNFAVSQYELPQYAKLECQECGCTLLDDLFQTDGNAVVKVNYDVGGEIVIPQQIDGVNITTIGAETFKGHSLSKITMPSIKNVERSAFEDCANLSEIDCGQLEYIGKRAFKNCGSLTELTLPLNVKELDDEAFAECNNLNYIELPSNVNSIGDGAFIHCNNLDIVVSDGNLNYLVRDNVLFDKANSKIIASGKINANIVVPDSVTAISDFAFYDKDVINTISFGKSNPLLGNYSFADCNNIETVYFYDYGGLNMSSTSFENDEFVAYVPYNSQELYRQAFAGISVSVISADTSLSFADGDRVVETRTVYYGSTLTDLPVWEKTGYTFSGWYDTPDCLGAPWQNGRLLEETANKILYAKWTPNRYTVNFEGEQCDGLQEITVTYNSPIGQLPILQKIGYTFDGWYDDDGQLYNSETVWVKADNATLHPSFSANKYKIYFEGNGGMTDVADMEILFGGSVTSLADASLAGYLFVGWNTSADGSGNVAETPFIYGEDGDTVLYAQWQVIEYNIYYNLNGGVQSDEVNPNTYTINDAVSFADPSRTGYSFVCWKIDEDIVTGIEKGSYGDVVVNAVWQANTYSVSFDSNGGLPTVDDITVTFDGEFSVDVKPVKEGHDFNGWFDKNGVQYALPNGKCTRLWDKAEDAVLHADWTVKSYEIQINDNGSVTWLKKDGISDESCTVEFGTVFSINLVAIFKQSSAGFKAGFIFDHFEYGENTIDWTSVPDLGENGAIVTIIPVWIRERHTIHFNALSEIVISDITAFYNDDISLPTVKRDGYIFVGWYDAPSYEQQVSWTVMPDLTPSEQANGSVVLFARYEYDYYRINYELDGGVNATDNPVRYHINSMLVLNNPSKTGYTFDGWYLDAEKTVKVNLSNFGIGNKTLYAKWTPIMYQIEYLPNGGQGVMEKSVHQYDIAKKLSVNTFSRTGYTFVGWAVSQNGSAVYADRELVANVPNCENSSVILLYAVWNANSYKVSYNANGGQGVMAQSDFIYDKQKTLSKNAFTMDGYSFIGWSKSSASKTAEYTNEQAVNNLTDVSNGLVVLYAVWSPNKYTVTFDKQGGTGGDSSKVVTYNESMPSATAPQRKGYTFKGYYAQPNGVGVQYYDENSPMRSVNNWNVVGNKTLYAFWEKTVYTITFDDGNGSVGKFYKTTVTYGEAMPAFRYYAPKRTGYAFEGYYSEPNGKGTKYYSMKLDNDQQSADIYGYDQYIIEILKPIGYWNKYENATLYANWKILECDFAYENVWLAHDCISTTTVHLIHGKSVTVTAQNINGYTFKYFAYKFVQYPQTTVTFNNIQLERGIDGKVRPVEYFSAVYEKNECVAAGTLITLANGKQVPVEELKGDEWLLVWNLWTGQFDSAPILFIDVDSAQIYQTINLRFSDGTAVKVISEHAFWDFDLNEYVYLRQDADKYIGHWFNKQIYNEDGSLGYMKVQLVDVDVVDEYTTAYSPVTYSHLCYYVNGMLSMPGGISGLFNIFEVDADTMKIDGAAMERDIAQYGLFTYEEFAEIYPVSEDVFNAFNAKYFKIAIGKGLIDSDNLAMLIMRYADFLSVI